MGVSGNSGGHPSPRETGRQAPPQARWPPDSALPCPAASVRVLEVTWKPVLDTGGGCGEAGN